MLCAGDGDPRKLNAAISESAFVPFAAVVDWDIGVSKNSSDGENTFDMGGVVVLKNGASDCVSARTGEKSIVLRSAPPSMNAA